jgi:hypothetical protein
MKWHGWDSIGVGHWVGLGLLLGLSVGCLREVAPERLSASVVAFGQYELQSGLLVRTASNAEVKCALGVIFGVEYRVDVEGWAFGALPVEFRWRHPELAVPARKIWGQESPARSPRPVLDWSEDALEGRALWTLEDPLELVDGRYEFVIRRLDDGAVLLSKAFLLGGC